MGWMHPVESDASLLNYNTFGIDCMASTLAVVECLEDIDCLIRIGLLERGRFKVIGQGSNLVFGEKYDGTAIVMWNKGIRVVSEDVDSVLVEAAAGEVWDVFVKHCIAQGWHGLENLVAIPGTVGAAAVQNIGAYGVDAMDVIESVKAFDTQSRTDVRFAADECAYGYRDSRFKRADKGRYIVTAVEFRLEKKFTPILTYKALADVFADNRHLDAAAVARAVEEIRWSKLPRPKVTGSAGSFFKNPVVTAAKFEKLKSDNPDMPAHAAEGGYKLAAGWLIERCGWKGRTLGRCGVYEKQALVLVNRGGCTGEEVRRLADRIIDDVEQKYGVTLECEAEFVGEM